MSDTPRTDAVKLLLTASNSPSEYVVDADFARQLERELADMTYERNTLKAAVDAECYWHERYVECKAERDATLAEAAKLRGALEEAVNRLSMPRYQREKGGT